MSAIVLLVMQVKRDDILIFRLMPYVHKSLISSSDVDSTSSVNDKSFDYFFNKHFISLNPKYDSK